jgi:hypothetical protein
MSVTGDWYNELHSKMVLKENGGQITGKYHTAVDAGKCTKGDYDLVGQIDTVATDNRVIAFVVLWRNADTDCKAITAWSGEVQKDETTKEDVIVATWLLTMETNPNDDWKSTLVGRDVFTRTPPLADTLRQAKMRMRAQP